MLLPQIKLRMMAALFVAAGTVTLQAQQPAFQQPPTPPQVSYNGGQLSVTANNSTFADVLTAVKNALGAEIEGVEPSSTERIFGQFGPASPGTVLGAFLAGSPYDFIVVGSEGGGPIQHIILSPRSNAGSHGMQTPNNSQPNNANNNNNNGNNNPTVTDQFSRVDPQWTVPQYVAPVPAQQQNNGQPGMPGSPGMGQNVNGQNPNAQPGDQRTAPYRPQHYGALYSPSNPPPPPYNPNAMNPNQQPQ